MIGKDLLLLLHFQADEHSLTYRNKRENTVADHDDNHEASIIKQLNSIAK